jgi:hypothetical protein
VSPTEKAFGGAKSSIQGFVRLYRVIVKRKVLEWPHPLSLDGYF